MSALARGQATNLPATPGISPGGTRFLQQWDRATRIQREELLHVLADRLLAGSRVGGPSSCLLSQHKKSCSSRLDFHLDVGSRWWTDGGEVAGRFPSSKPPRISHPTRAPSGPNSVCLSGLTGTGHSYHTDSCLHPKGCPAGAVAHHTGSVMNGAEAENSPCRGRAAEATASRTTRERDAAGFLELLGPHAGLLAARVSSQLKASYAGGHAVGQCLRVCALLAESTTGQLGNSDAVGRSSIHPAPSASLLGQQLCTPEVISAALEIAAAPPSATVVVDYRYPNPTTERTKRARSRQTTPKAMTAAKPWSSSPENAQQQEEKDRGEALRLLLALVRVGGKRVKEYLTCPGRSSLPNDNYAASSHGSSDAFERIVRALRRPACRSEVRTAGARLLVELGLGDHHHHPTGSSRERVWNAVLCLLNGLDDKGSTDGQVLGCRIASDLLAASSPKQPQGNCGDGRGPDPLLGDSRSRQPRLMRPELVLLPSVLGLSLSDRCEVRKAAGELAVLLVKYFPHPCCYLLVACLVGLFGLISGVERGAPVAWIECTRPRPRPRSRCGQAVGMEDGDLQNRTADEMDEPRYERELEDDGRNINRHQDHGQQSSVEHNIFRGQSSVAEGTVEDFFIHSADGRGATTGTPESSFESPPVRPADSNRGTASHDDEAIYALDLVRRICTEGGSGEDESMRLALAHALAPLAAFDLVVGSARPVGDGFSRDPGDATDTEAGINGTVFVTQTEQEAGRAGEVDSDGGKADAGGDSPPLQQDEDVPRFGGNNRPRDEGPQPVSFQDELVRGCSGDGRRLADRRGCCCAQPTEALCFAVAEALLAMYHRDLRGRIADGAGTLETLDAVGMIDAALDACPTLSCCLRDGDTQAMARIFSSCTSRGGHDSGAGTSVELCTLRQNLLALSAQMSQVKPPPPPPAPPPAAAPRSGAECDRPGARHHNRSNGCDDGTGGRKVISFSENDERHADATETPFPAGFSGEGPRDWMEPNAEGTGVTFVVFS